MSTATTSDASGWHGPIVVKITFETVLGLLAAFFIGFFAPVVFAILSLVGMAHRRMDLVSTALPLSIATAWLALLIARMAADASLGRIGQRSPGELRGDPDLPALQLPFALAMAAQLPAFSWFWRPWLGLWWLGHFCAAATFGHFVAVNLIRRLDLATAVVAIPLAVVVHFSFLFASNLYLVLAARAIVPSPRLCVRVWRFRFLIDFLLALAMVIRGVR